MPSQPSLPSAITFSEGWFILPVRVFPHQTDYAGVVWHGTYITWMEELRVESLSFLGIDYHHLVALGCDLPVIDLTLRYHQFVKLGMTVLVKGRLLPIKGVRMVWDYQLVSEDSQHLYVSGKITLVPVSRETGKVLRFLPPQFQEALAKIEKL